MNGLAEYANWRCSLPGLSISLSKKLIACVLDLTRNGALPADLLRRLDEIAETQREAFNGLIADLSRGHERDIDWWVSRPACRNTHASMLFGRCMQLALIRSLIAEGRRVEVRTDEPELAQVLRSELGNLVVVRAGRMAQIFRRAITLAWNLGSALFHTVMSFWAARKTRRFMRSMPKSPITVLETYVQRDSFEQGDFCDRYYPTLYETLSKSERQQLYYFPIVHRLRKYLLVFRNMRQSERNFLIREDYLRGADYTFALGHWWRIRKLFGKGARFADFDIGPLVDAELRAGRFANTSVQALLHYRFWCNARHRGLAVERIIDWYEGHDFDHATAAAINWHDPNGPTLISFRPVAPASYLSVTPARHEVAHSVVPPIWAVVGSETRADIARANPELIVLPAPGLRHLRLLNFKRQVCGDGLPLVLVLLTTEPDLVETLFKTIAPIIASERARKYRWLVKRHPAMPPERMKSIFEPAARYVEFVEGDIYDWLGRVDAAIGLATNTLLEAMVAGVPVICVTSGNLPSERPLPLTQTGNLYRICYSSAETAEALEEALRGTHAQRPDLRDALLGPFDNAIARRLVTGFLPASGNHSTVTF